MLIYKKIFYMTQFKSYTDYIGHKRKNLEGN